MSLTIGVALPRPRPNHILPLQPNIIDAHETDFTRVRVVLPGDNLVQRCDMQNLPSFRRRLPTLAERDHYTATGGTRQIYLPPAMRRIGEKPWVPAGRSPTIRR